MKNGLKLFLCISAVFIFSFSSHAQFFLGAKGGVTIPNLTAGGDNPVSGGWSSRLGPYFGIVAEEQFSKTFSMQEELNYSSQGGKKNGVQGIASSDYFAPNPVPPGTPKYVYATFNNEAVLNYLELPLLLKISFPLGKDLSFFIDGGPYAGYLLKAKHISSGTSMVYADKEETQPFPIPAQSFDSTTDVTSQIKRFNAGIQGGIGLQVNAGKNKLMLTGGVNYGFVNIQKNEDDGKNNTGAATITLAYLFKL